MSRQEKERVSSLEEDEKDDSLDSASPLAAVYAARLKDESDYARYKACKESFYTRLAALSALQTYGLYLPSLVGQFQLQQQQASTLAALTASAAPSPPHRPFGLPSPPSLTPAPSYLLQKQSTSPTTPLEIGTPTASPTPSPKQTSPSPIKKAKLQSSPLSGSSSSSSSGSPPKRKMSRRSAASAAEADKTSPVSGTIIRVLAEGEQVPAIRKGKKFIKGRESSSSVKLFTRKRYRSESLTRSLFSGDIDPEFNVVEVTEEAKAELAKIENKIGDFICRLCKEVYDDAFGLAQHRSVDDRSITLHA